MLKFFFSGAPNPTKVALFLEEAGLPYEAIPVDARKGDQHKPEFLAVNPNAKVPAIVDGDVTVFDSNAILLYLAEKTGKFLPPKSDKLRGELLSWLMFVASGIGPYSGQLVHFRTYAPEKNEYAINRYAFEAQRHFGIVDARLAKHKYMVGEPTRSSIWICGAGQGSSPCFPAKPPGRNSPTSSGWSTKSAPGRRRSARSHSRTSTSSRPRWTTKRAARCSVT